MLIELRTYDFAPGAATRYLQLFGTEGLKLITRHLPLGGYWITETGTLNRLRHIWIYADMAERAARRSRLMADSKWAEDFLPRGLAMIGVQRTQFLALRTSSSAFDAVLSKRDAHHAGLAPGAQPLGEAFWVFDEGLARPQSEDPVFAAQVLAGDGTGSWITISRLANDELPEPVAGDREVLRDVAFSPLV